MVTTQYVGEAAYCDLVGVLAGGRILAWTRPMACDGEPWGRPLRRGLHFPPARDDLVALTRSDGVTKVTWLDDHSVRLVVADAGEVPSTLDDWASERGLEMERSEAHLPPFDDVFVELVAAATTTTRIWIRRRGCPGGLNRLHEILTRSPPFSARSWCRFGDSPA